MATTVRKLTDLMAKHAAGALNAIRADIARVKAGLIFHADASAADASPVAADLPSVIVMANNLKAEINVHIANAIDATTTDAAYGAGIHVAADATNPVSAAAASDQGTADTLLNAIKTAFNAHLTQAGVHITNDATNTCNTTNASDLGTSITLANALQTKINAHFAAAMQHQATKLVAP